MVKISAFCEGEIEVKGNKEEGQIILAPGQRAELNKKSGRLTSLIRPDVR